MGIKGFRRFSRRVTGFFGSARSTATKPEAELSFASRIRRNQTAARPAGHTIHATTGEGILTRTLNRSKEQEVALYEGKNCLPAVRMDWLPNWCIFFLAAHPPKYIVALIKIFYFNSTRALSLLLVALESLPSPMRRFLWLHIPKSGSFLLCVSFWPFLNATIWFIIRFKGVLPIGNAPFILQQSIMRGDWMCSGIRTQNFDDNIKYYIMS